jgi:hypothetical protein
MLIRKPEYYSRTGRRRKNFEDENKIMKKTTLALVALAILAGSLVLATETNNPASSTNSPVKLKPYPLDYCLVSGEKFGGDMGNPVVTNYDGQEIKFCCPDCIKDFRKDPDKYMKELKDAEKGKK